MARGPLGFGMMRLPVLSGPTDFDYKQLNQMVDMFLGAGYSYFDTSFVYHNGTSEAATHKAVVARHARDEFTIATKFPTFAIQSEDQVEGTFAQQLDNLGVDYVDYYLLHNIQTRLYDGIDGSGNGIVNTAHLFDHMVRWKEEGRVRHIGFSFHSSAALLDRILTEHPEIEFVQIALNYIDWDSELVQAKQCYEVIRRHGKEVIVMEPVKGGFLSDLPEPAARILTEANPNASQASWAIRFAAELDGVLVVLSGMSTLEQVKDNVSTMANLRPLTAEEHRVIGEAARVARDAGRYQQDFIDRFGGMTYGGIPVTAILQTANILALQPNPSFSDDNSYPSNAVAENIHVDFKSHEPTEKVILPDGTDETETVAGAYEYLKSMSF